jgi:hypothetical protein
MWILSASVASSATRRVVVLFDERPELPGLAAFDAEFVDKFASGSAEHVEVFREAMDLTRFGSDAHTVLLRYYLRKKYADKQTGPTRQPPLKLQDARSRAGPSPYAAGSETDSLLLRQAEGIRRGRLHGAAHFALHSSTTLAPGGSHVRGLPRAPSCKGRRGRQSGHAMCGSALDEDRQ